jgi:hypothetical protein
MLNFKRPTPARLAASAATLVMLFTPAIAAAQIGAIAAVPGGDGEQGDLIATPIFAGSAMILPQGRFSAGVYGVGLTASGRVDGTPFTYDATAAQLSAGVAFAPFDRLMFGATIIPVIRREFTISNGLSEDESGRGDAFVYGTYQLFRTPNRQTALAANASVGFPTSEVGFGNWGTSIGLGLSLSHRMDRLSFHGAGGVGLPQDDRDGKTGFSYTGAVVMQAAPIVSLSAEVLGASSDGFNSVDAGGGARFRVLTNVVSPNNTRPYDVAGVIGVTVAP